MKMFSLFFTETRLLMALLSWRRILRVVFAQKGWCPVIAGIVSALADLLVAESVMQGNLTGTHNSYAQEP